MRTKKSKEKKKLSSWSVHEDKTQHEKARTWSSVNKVDTNK